MNPVTEWSSRTQINKLNQLGSEAASELTFIKPNICGVFTFYKFLFQHANTMHNHFNHLAPTISLGSHQNIGLHTGARANVVLLTKWSIEAVKQLKLSIEKSTVSHRMHHAKCIECIIV